MQSEARLKNFGASKLGVRGARAPRAPWICTWGDPGYGCWEDWGGVVGSRDVVEVVDLGVGV